MTQPVAAWRRRTRIQRIGTAWSQFWNAVFGGNPDQSFSSRSWEAMRLGIWWGCEAVRLIDFGFLLFAGERDHCWNAYQSDDERTYS